MTSYKASPALGITSAGFDRCAADHVEGQPGGPLVGLKGRGASDERGMLREMVIGATHLQRTGSLSVEPTGPRSFIPNYDTRTSHLVHMTPRPSLSISQNRDPQLSSSPSPSWCPSPSLSVVAPHSASAAHGATIMYDVSWTGSIIHAESVYF